MKKIIVALILVAFAGTAFGADVIEYAAPKKGKVTFNHKAHQLKLNDCTKCHASAAGGKIEGFGKDLAHGKACKDCHKTMNGPTGCNDCHKK